ncbi:hypothetical protein NUW54_g3681 [Trametes sanguinea]|uniref:Uncharacterized protein n=1 Tax=Trametes sanguinea TaxID=158606 RepID=A0ACC1Q0L6_9APHY|nr:hypothetical protein NUW54_g3681 [Trametes sanguinea]
MPTVPAGVPAAPPQPPFDAILVSPVPNSTLDPSKIIVSLETSTATHKTTMATLVSRPSHMASYLLELFPSNDADTQSVYSNNSDVESSFNSIFNHHLASSGVLTRTSTNLHVFLDRPSAPYAHILAYLRSPHSTPDAPAVLPHAARLNGSTARLEALTELRDEAAYLGLQELELLCNIALRNPVPHARARESHDCGRTGITPMLQIIRAALKNPLDRTKLSLIYANVNPEDILLKKELDELAAKHSHRFRVYYVLNNPPPGWEGGAGFVTKEHIEQHMPRTDKDIKVLMCGPPPMITAMKKHLAELNYPAPRTVSKLEDQAIARSCLQKVRPRRDAFVAGLDDPSFFSSVLRGGWTDDVADVDDHLCHNPLDYSAWYALKYALLKAFDRAPPVAGLGLGLGVSEGESWSAGFLNAGARDDVRGAVRQVCAAGLLDAESAGRSE